MILNLESSLGRKHKMVTFESPQLELIQQLIGGAESEAVRAVSNEGSAARSEAV